MAKRRSEKAQEAARCSNPLGLRHPALTQTPTALRASAPPVTLPVAGGIRVKPKQSPYSATAARLERKGEREATVMALLRVRRHVLDGHSLLDAVADGTLAGWAARMVLADALGSTRLPQWDAQEGRTQIERRHICDKALSLAGYIHAGGWTVTR